MNLQNEIAKSSNRIESNKTDAEKWFVGIVNKLDFDKWFENENKASEQLVKIIDTKFISDFIPEIISEGKRFYKAIFDENGKASFDNDWIKITNQRIENAQQSWINSFNLKMNMLNRNRKTKTFMLADWQSGLPVLSETLATSRNRKQKKLKISGGGVYYYPLWRDLNRAISESYDNLATLYRNRIING